MRAGRKASPGFTRRESRERIDCSRSESAVGYSSGFSFPVPLERVSPPWGIGRGLSGRKKGEQKIDIPFFRQPGNPWGTHSFASHPHEWFALVENETKGAMIRCKGPDSRCQVYF